MFPFNENPISVLRTSADIEKFGRQALLRALNIGRVVAFVGSGTSLKFGQPSWDTFAKRGEKLFFALENAIMAHNAWTDAKDYSKRSPLAQDFKDTLTPLVKEIKELRNCSGFQPSHLIELIEDYFAEVCPLLERHGLSVDDLRPVKEDAKVTLPELRKRAVEKATALLKAPGEDNAWRIAHFGDGADQFDPKNGVENNDEKKKWVDYYFGPDDVEETDIGEFSTKISAFRRAFASQFDIAERDRENRPTRLRKSKCFEELVSGLGLTHSDSVRELDNERADINKIDAARSLRRRLGVRRFLTLNYDLELEMMLFEEGRATPTEAYKDFETFLIPKEPDKSTDLPYEPGRAVTLESPSGRVIRSSSSRKETLADLFSFGAFPTNYDASVHHLHGRIDDPENMIITPKDYQRIYYGASDQKKSFDEARHAVFTGSDVLVLGMGTSEQDVLKPLRDFLELETDRRDSYGNVYYITAAEFSGKDPSLSKAFANAQRDAKAKTQRLYKDYGMHTLFFDLSFETERTRSWTQKGAQCFAARAEIANYIYELGEVQSTETTEDIEAWSETDVATEFESIFDPIYSYDGDPETKIAYQKNTATTLARELVGAWNGLGNKERTKEKRDTLKQALKAIDAHLKDAGLVNFVRHLEKSRRAWWSDWSQLPGFRVAVLGPHRYELDLDTKYGTKNTDDVIEKAALDPKFKVNETKDDRPLVWRQTNLDAHFQASSLVLGTTEKTPQFTGLLAATAVAREKAQLRAKELRSADGFWASAKHPIHYPASIARISIPPGGGKGRLLTYFTTEQTVEGSEGKIWPFQTLFGSDINGAATPYAGYKACFMSHLTFALEFSGTVIAFARLLQNMLWQLREEVKGSTAYEDPSWKEMLGHQFQQRTSADPYIKTLREMFELLQRTCPSGGWKTRIVAIFSYLDRLVDEQGDAYSPTHRAFFRLISGWNDLDAHMRLPIDMVFINSHADLPIRYLSVEKPIKPQRDERRDEKWKSSNWKLRRDRGVALENWTELKRVRPKIIFKEALNHSAIVANIANDKRGTQVGALEVALEIEEDENDFLPLPSNLKKFMYRRVANGHFLAGLATAIWNLPGSKNDFDSEWKSCISALDIAYAREKSKGLIDELLGIYRRLDRISDDDGCAGLEQKLSRIGSSRRIRDKERLRTMTIDHMALFQVPCTPETLIACPDIEGVVNTIDKGKKTDDPDKLQVLINELDRLVERGLASRYIKFADRIKREDKNPDKRSYVYVLNTKVASVLRARANLEVYSQYRLMVFQPNVYPSQPERALKPDMIHFERVSSVVRALVKSTQQEMVLKYWKMRKGEFDWKEDDTAKFSAEMERCNDKLRAAYALIRGTFSISVIARLAEGKPANKRQAPFDEYRTWTRKLLNTATLLGKIREIDMKRRLKGDGRTKSKDPLPYNHPFLRDEVSWLYNERALVSFVQGRLFDALPLFEQASAILGTSSERSSPQSEGATNRRIQMNFALAQIERGNIVTAQSTLERIVTESDERWKSDTPSVINCMARGFMALCHHLTNEFTRAKSGYEDVLKDIGQFNHPRAESILRRHYADLLRAMSTPRNDVEYKEAISNLRSSEELALGIRATDLNHYAIMAQARLHRDMQERGQALENLRRVEEYARSMGIQKMLCEVLKVRGEVLLAEGETTQAGFVTAQSIAISKRNGMRLRKISASIIQARILYERNQIEDAKRLLNETITESQALGYATKTSQALNFIKH